MLKVYLINKEKSEGMWLPIPSNGSQDQEVLYFSEGCTLEIGAVISSEESLKVHLVGKIIQPYRGINEITFLDRQTEGMTEKEKAVFQAALDIVKPCSIIDIINLSCNLDNVILYEGVTDYEELGKRLLESGDIARERGCFTEYGYAVLARKPFQRIYDGKKLPDPVCDSSCIILVDLYSRYYAAKYFTYHISLPASEERLALAEKNLGGKTLDAHKIININCPVRELRLLLPFSDNVREINEFARVLAEKGIMKDAGLRNKLFAAMEAELPENMAQAKEIAENLEYYEFLPWRIRTAADYADYYLEKEKISIGDSLKPFFDYDAFGKRQMRMDSVAETKYGLILRVDRPIRQLPEELTGFKLFSPLKGILHLDSGGDVSDQAEEISPRELCRFKDEIQKRVRQNCFEKEGDRGFVYYLENRLLERKIFSMIPTVELWNGELWGVLEVKTYGNLSPQELSRLERIWEERQSCDWGEDFEQQQIETEEGYISVSFWNSSDDFFIKTEQELKQEQSQKAGMQMGGSGLFNKMHIQLLI